MSSISGGSAGFPVSTQTMSMLIIDVLPRLTNAPKGINIYQAANSILSLLYKKLLDRSSDLLATGELNLVIPSYGYSADLPSDFISPAEKPRAEEMYTDWMAGLVISYNAITGVLVVDVRSMDGTDTLTNWYVAQAIPGQPSVILGSSATSMTPTLGNQTLTVQTGLDIPVGMYVFIIPEATIDAGAADGVGLGIPIRTDYHFRKVLEPQYLVGDDNEDDRWWTHYGHYGEASEPPCNRPSRFKIIGNTFYVRPKVIIPVVIKGRYNQKPVDLSTPTDIIPWGLFYEVFREGVVRIILKSIAIPDADSDFMLFFKREVDTIINSRYKTLPRRRTPRSQWM